MTDKPKTKAQFMEETEEMRLKIAELEKVKKALAESDAQKMAILDGVTSNVLFINKDMEIIWANKMAANSLLLTIT